MHASDKLEQVSIDAWSIICISPNSTAISRDSATAAGLWGEVATCGGGGVWALGEGAFGGLVCCHCHAGRGHTLPVRCRACAAAEGNVNVVTLRFRVL